MIKRLEGNPCGCNAQLYSPYDLQPQHNLDLLKSCLLDAAIKSAAALGVTITVASEDNGSSCSVIALDGNLKS
jgi:hypothetical protein